MTTDWKALCAELLGELCCHYRSWELKEGIYPDAMKRANAALAEPEPEGPTDEEIMELMTQQMRDDLAAAARALSSYDLNYIKAASTFRIILNRHAVDHARAVLTKWGHQ